MKESLQKKVDRAIKLLQSVAKGYDEYIEVAYSGGKDSDVILHLARRAGIKIRPIYRSTTIDPPGTIAHVKANGVEIVRPEKSFFQIIEQNGLPSRNRRFCCKELKEYKIMEKTIIGVRKAESVKRARLYKEPTSCKYYGKAKKPENHVEAIYPILDWTNEDVLNYIEENQIQLHPLYYREDGTIDIKRRLGCMCCPLKYYKSRVEEFRQHPVMVHAYCRAAQKFLKTHPNTKTAKKYTDVYQLFFRNLFFDEEKKWKKWLADNETSLLCIRNYRQFLMDYFKVNYL